MFSDPEEFEIKMKTEIGNCQLEIGNHQITASDVQVPGPGITLYDQNRHPEKPAGAMAGEAPFSFE